MNKNLDMLEEAYWNKCSGPAEPTFWRMNKKTWFTLMREREFFTYGDPDKILFGLPVFFDDFLGDGQWVLEVVPIVDYQNLRIMEERMEEARRAYRKHIVPLNREIYEKRYKLGLPDSEQLIQNSGVSPT